MFSENNKNVEDDGKTSNTTVEGDNGRNEIQDNTEEILAEIKTGKKRNPASGDLGSSTTSLETRTPTTVEIGKDLLDLQKRFAFSIPTSYDPSQSGSSHVERSTSEESHSTGTTSNARKLERTLRSIQRHGAVSGDFVEFPPSYCERISEFFSHNFNCFESDRCCLLKCLGYICLWVRILILNPIFSCFFEMFIWLCRLKKVKHETVLEYMLQFFTMCLAHFSHIFFFLTTLPHYAYNQNLRYTDIVAISCHLLFIFTIWSLFIFFCWCRVRRGCLNFPLALLINYVYVGIYLFSPEYFPSTSSMVTILIIPSLYFVIIDVSIYFKILWVLPYIFLLCMSFLYSVSYALIRNETIEISPVDHIFSSVIQFSSYLISAAFVFAYMGFGRFQYTQLTRTVTRVTKELTKNFDSNLVDDRHMADLLGTKTHMLTEAFQDLQELVRKCKEVRAFLPQQAVAPYTGLKDRVNSNLEIEEYEMEEPDSIAVPDRFEFAEYSGTNSVANSENLSDSDSDDFSCVSDYSEASDFSLESISREKVKEALSRKDSRRKGSTEKGVVAGLCYALDKKYGTVVKFRLSGLSKTKKASTFYFYLSKFYELVRKITLSHHGVVLGALNDYLICGWNIKNTVLTHEYYATITAFLVVQEFNNNSFFLDHSIDTVIDESTSRRKKAGGDQAIALRDIPKIPLEILVSVSSSEIKHGNMGCEELKSYNYFGEAVDHVNVMSNYCSRGVGENSSIIVVGKSTAKKIKIFFKLIFVNVLQVGEKKFSIYRVLGKEKIFLNKSSKSIKKKRSDEKDREFEKLCKISKRLENAFKLGNYELAEEILNNLSLSVNLGGLFSELQKNIENKIGYTKIEFSY